MTTQFVISEYIEHAMAQAEYNKLPDGSFAGRIPCCKGVVAFGSTSHECATELRSTLEGWLLVCFRLGHALPVIEGINLNIAENDLGVARGMSQRSSSHSLEAENFEISKEGFDAEDAELIQAAANRVAPAMRNVQFKEISRFYQVIVENSPDPIIVVDKQGRIRVFNMACERIWGFRADEVIGNSVSRYYESEEYARGINKLLMESPRKRIQDFQARIKDHKGEIIPISLSASLLFDDQGNRLGSIGMFKDLRAALRMQEEITRAEKLVTLGKLAHTAGHDIKHDIAIALNYIDVLIYECNDDGSELLEIYRDIQEALAEALNKFQNMLSVGRPRSPAKQSISVGEIFRRVEASMRRRSAAREIEFLIDYPDDENELEADVGQLKQVLLNLFDNSLDAIEVKNYRGLSGERGRIELSAQANHGYLQVTWKDNGCGISGDKLPTIFTPFFTDKPNGSGLGLFIVKNIIENHGGKISVNSDEGIETKFEIVIPLLQKS